MDGDQLLALVERVPDNAALEGLSQDDQDHVKGVCLIWCMAPPAERPSIAELTRLISMEVDMELDERQMRRFLEKNVYPTVALDKPMVVRALQDAGVRMDSIVMQGEIAVKAHKMYLDESEDSEPLKPADRIAAGKMATKAVQAYTEELERARLVPPKRTESVHAHAHFDTRGAEDDLLGRRRRPRTVDAEGGRTG